MNTGQHHYDQLVFSGGGTRCFWQGGFLDVVRGKLALDPARIAGVSGGALTGVGFIAHCGPRVLETMKSAFAAQDSNIPWNEPDDTDGLTLHQRVYRDVIEEVVTINVASDVANGPAYQILLGHPPGDSTFSATAATIAYEAELHLINAPHFNWAEKIGVTSTLVDANAAARDGRLADLVCAAATIPPIFEMPLWDGKPVIDGGMADQAPMPDPDSGRTLVLLTRHYRNVPDHPDRHYIAPEIETPADKIDFTDPDKIQKTWDCGVVDGRQFLQEHQIN